MVAADSLIRFVKRESGYVYSDELSLPHLGALFLQKNCVGYCRESCDLSVYVLRSVGIPVATDFIISAPEAQGGHSWNVIKDGCEKDRDAHRRFRAGGGGRSCGAGTG